MKRLVLIITLTLCSNTLLFAADNRYALGVDGLACPFCAYGIEKQLSAIEGVETVEIDVHNGQAIVTVREGAVLTEAAARRAVTDSGFTLGSFTELQQGE